MTTKKKEVQEKVFVDPMAQNHKRILGLKINDVEFEFHWTRALVAELVEITTGQGQLLNESMKDSVNRLLHKTVDSSQLGLLIDVLNNKSNFTLTEKLISDMLPLITKNETIVGNPVCTSDGDVKSVAVPLVTDNKKAVFTFRSDRARYDNYNANQHTDDLLIGIKEFLSECLESEEESQKFNLLDMDERNFTLAVKVFGKVTHFLAQNQAITTAPTLKKSVK